MGLLSICLHETIGTSAGTVTAKRNALRKLSPQGCFAKVTPRVNLCLLPWATWNARSIGQFNQQKPQKPLHLFIIYWHFNLICTASAGASTLLAMAVMWTAPAVLEGLSGAPARSVQSERVFANDACQAKHAPCPCLRPKSIVDSVHSTIEAIRYRHRNKSPHHMSG
jgi:hypothetical protein